MRILHLSTRLILGGSQENTILSCEGQADRGHVVGLVYGPIYGPEGSLLERVRAHGGIETIETPHLVRQLSPWRDWRCYRDLREIISAFRPDVVHTHSSKAGILGRLAAWNRGVPCVVHTIHGLAFHPYQGRCRNAVYIQAERVAARRCHRLVCVADAMAAQARAAGIGRPEQYVTIYSGMEVQDFLEPRWSRREVRTALGYGPEDFVLGTVSRLAELKGHDDLLDSLHEDMRDRPKLKLLWVGDGWWRSRLMDRVRRLGLEDRVTATGLVPPEQIPRMLLAMDVLAHPSYREGLPRSVVQALLSEVPAIAYDVDGTREVCIDGRTGRLVAPGDRAGLREAVLWLMDHPDERRTMGRQGREQCARRFDASVMVDELERLYQQVLEEGDSAAETRRPPGA
jgi:glycosyltransferase involved in cell wall biosynthesis